MTWLSLALGLVQLLNWVFSKLDAQSKETALRKLIDDQQTRDDLDAIRIADAARAGVPTDDVSLRAPDEHSRT